MLENVLNTYSKSATIIQVIDTHTAGNVARVVVGGIPEIKGKTMMEKMDYMKKNIDYIRTIVTWQPRGHETMYATVLLSL